MLSYKNILFVNKRLHLLAPWCRHLQAYPNQQSHLQPPWSVQPYHVAWTRRYHPEWSSSISCIASSLCWTVDHRHSLCVLEQERWLLLLLWSSSSPRDAAIEGHVGSCSVHCSCPSPSWALWMVMLLWQLLFDQSASSRDLPHCFLPSYQHPLDTSKQWVGQ